MGFPTSAAKSRRSRNPHGAHPRPMHEPTCPQGEAIGHHIAELRREGLPVPKPVSQGEFVDVQAV